MTGLSLFSAAAIVADVVYATVAAAWPRSEVRYELDRLREEGHLAGEMCEMAFSVSFADAATAADASAEMRRVGYAIDLAGLERGFVTARRAVRLTPWELAQAVTRLERVTRARGGFVAVIGPTRGPAAAPLAVRATRVEHTGEMAAAL